MEEQDAGTKRIGVACKACGVAISWECNYCPECGATEMFQPRVKKMPLPGGGVPTRAQAQRDYQRNQSKHVQKKNRHIVGEDMLAAAFAAGQHGTGHDNDENASPAVTQHGEKRKRRKRGKDVAAASAAARQAARHGTIVKPHTFASYGVSTAKSKNQKQQKQQSMSSSQQQHRQAPAGNLGRAKRRGKRRSAYDASLARLLEKEPELERKTTVLDGPIASNSSSSGGTAQDTVTNKNAHLTDVLTTLCKIERAEGNLLPAASYERAALSLSTHPTSVHSAKDLLGVRNVDNTAAAKVEEILEAETRRQLGGGRDVMEHASDLIAAFSRQSFANKSQDRAAQAARLRLTAMLEEEQEREREREAFWREPGTQLRTDAEKQELLAIFEDERRQGSDNILALLPEVLGREKAMSMVTGMEAAGAPPATPAELYRDSLPGMVDSGWIGGTHGSSAEVDGSSALLVAAPNGSQEMSETSSRPNGATMGVPEVEIITTALPSIAAGGSSLGESRVFPVESKINPSHLKNDPETPAPIPTSENMLPSLLPFAHQVLDTEDELDARKRLPGYKKNMIHVDRSVSLAKDHVSGNGDAEADPEWEYEDGVYDELEIYDEDPRVLRRERYLANSMMRSAGVKNAQKQRHAKRIRKRPRMIPPKGNAGSVDVMVHVLDDDREAIVPDLSSVFPREGEGPDGRVGGGNGAAVAAPSSGMFWGPGLSVSTGNRSAVNIGMVAATSTTTAIAGGGAFWGAKMQDAALRDRKTSETRKAGRQNVSVQDEEDEEEEEDDDMAAGDIDPRVGVHDRSWQLRQRARLRSQGRRIRRRNRLTKYAWSRAESSERVKRVRVVEVDTSDRGPSVGGIGTLKTPQTQEEKDEDLVQEHDVVMTPMLSASCRIPGSVNNGRGEYGVVTVMSVARALTREAGGGSDATKTGDIAIKGYLPRSSSQVSTSLTREEVVFLLGAGGGTVGGDGSKEGKEEGSSTDMEMGWFHASQVQSYGASLRYMRPYWKRHVGPLLKRLELHEEPVGGADFSTRVPCLQIDRCVKSKTRYRIPPVEKQEYMSSSFPANVQRATVIVRLERRARPKLRPGQKSTVAEQKLEAVRRKKLGKYEDEPGGDLALSCTVVFRGGYGGGTSSGGYSLASTTCRCVLPFPAIAKRIEVPGLGPNVSALDIVRAGKRDELIDAVLSRLRLAMLCPSKFARAVPLSEVSSGAHELQLLFDWQRPKRDLIVGDPVDDKIVKFLAPHQREMIRLYREAMVSLLPSERPPSSHGEEKEEEQPAANADADRLQLEKTAAVRIQSRARQWMARERVEALRNLRDDEGMVFTSESDSEEVESADEDSDAEEVINVRFRMHQACHLNGKLVDLRMRVCDVAGGLNKEEGGEGSSVDMHTAIHVKVVEPKGRKIARICVEGEKLDSVLDRSLPDTDESPLSTVAAVEAGDPLAVMCVKLFHALQLFQSRARGILLLKVKEDAELSDEGKDGGNHTSPSRSKNGAYVESKQDDAKRGGVLALERKLSTQKSLTSLAHSPMVTRSAEEGDAVESTGKAFRKTLSPHDPTLSPPMPSAPKASRGAPPTLDESTVGDEDLDEEEALKTYRPEVIMAAAARNWRPDSAVERPDEVPTLPLKKIKSRRRY